MPAKLILLTRGGAATEHWLMLRRCDDQGVRNRRSRFKLLHHRILHKRKDGLGREGDGPRLRGRRREPGEPGEQGSRGSAGCLCAIGAAAAPLPTRPPQGVRR